MPPTKSPLDIFFEDPLTDPKEAGTVATSVPSGVYNGRLYGTLYHARRSAISCFNLVGEANEIRAPWPGAMCVMASIDLLACFYAGNTARGGNKARFINFLENVGMFSNADALIIYGFRNALLHNFSFISLSGRYRVVADITGRKLLKPLGTNKLGFPPFSGHPA